MFYKILVSVVFFILWNSEWFYNSTFVIMNECDDVQALGKLPDLKSLLCSLIYFGKYLLVSLI